MRFGDGFRMREWGFDTKLKSMEIPFAADVEEEERFRDAVREGIAAADRGEFVEHEEVWGNIEKILQS
jgi:predicted transcriptional regulator